MLWKVDPGHCMNGSFQGPLHKVVLTSSAPLPCCVKWDKWPDGLSLSALLSTAASGSQEAGGGGPNACRLPARPALTTQEPPSPSPGGHAQRSSLTCSPTPSPSITLQKSRPGILLLPHTVSPEEHLKWWPAVDTSQGSLGPGSSPLLLQQAPHVLSPPGLAPVPCHPPCPSPVLPSTWGQKLPCWQWSSVFLLLP